MEKIVSGFLEAIVGLAGKSIEKGIIKSIG